jgi:hypothetical protein
VLGSVAPSFQGVADELSYLKVKGRRGGACVGEIERPLKLESFRTWACRKMGKTVESTLPSSQLL